MSALRLLVTAGVAATVAALGARLAAERGPAPAAAPPPLRGVPAAIAAPRAPVALAAVVPPSTAAPGVHERVPPGILTRAADARALERTGCPAAGGGREACGPRRAPLEIDWDVQPDP